MKKTVSNYFLSILFLGLVLFTLGCQKSNENQASVPAVNSNCINNPQTCNSQLYLNNTGFSGYPMGGSNNGGSGYVFGGNGYYTSGATPFYFANSAAYLCNCPFGSVPTYNTYSGLGCVQSQYIGSSYTAYGWGPNNGQWLNIPQISNVSGYPNSSCYNGVIQSCVVGATNSCTAGYTCRYTTAASTLGFCQPI